MAEEPTGTQPPTGQNPAPGTADPGLSSTQGTQTATTTVELPLAPSAPATPSPLENELKEMRALAERYKQQLQGWETQSKKHQEEKQQLQTQLQQYDTILKTVGAVTNPTNPSTAKPKPASFREAMDRYLGGDDSALESFSPTVQTEQVQTIVNQQLNNYLSYMGKQQAVTTAHPELADRNHPIYKEAFDAYDTLAADPLNKTLFPEDPSMQVSIISPDGTYQKPMDLRILNSAVLQAKAQHARETGAREETTRRSAGDAMTGNGRQVSSSNNQVEAYELFGDDEKREWQNQQQIRAWPRHWPTEPKAVAKFLWDGLSPVEKQKRLEAYRDRGRR